jgi:hypothetical protein
MWKEKCEYLLAPAANAYAFIKSVSIESSVFPVVSALYSYQGIRVSSTSFNDLALYFQQTMSLFAFPLQIKS